MLEVAKGELKVAGSKREDSSEEIDGREVGGSGEGEDLTEVVLVGLFEIAKVGGSENNAGSEGDCRIEETLGESPLLGCCKSSEMLSLTVEPVCC